jgi:hypothetical protein
MNTAVRTPLRRSSASSRSGKGRVRNTILLLGRRLPRSKGSNDHPTIGVISSGDLHYADEFSGSSSVASRNCLPRFLVTIAANVCAIAHRSTFRTGPRP